MASKRGIVYDIRRKIQTVLYDLTSPEFVSRIYFRKYMGYKLNLDHPTTFNEKNQWLKLYEWPNNALAIQCGDKYTVRAYIEEKGLGEYLNELLGVWDNVVDIDWDKLPDQFALKVTNGCAYNIICDDKDKLDIESVKKQLKKWMKEDFGKFNAEPHYSKMKSRIICEKYLGGEMIDYKFYCYDGIAKFCYIAQGDAKEKRFTFFDRDGKIAPFQRADYTPYLDAKVPSEFEKMIELSEKLAKDFICVRVDWYEVNGKIYFGEMTFTPNAALIQFEPKEYDKILGELIHLPEKTGTGDKK